MSSGKHLFRNSLIFQQDNEPKHAANAAKTYLDTKTHNGTISAMNWPLQSSDLSIIEAVWEHVDRDENKMHPNRIFEFPS